MLKYRLTDEFSRKINNPGSNIYFTLCQCWYSDGPCQDIHDPAFTNMVELEVSDYYWYPETNTLDVLLDFRNNNDLNKKFLQDKVSIVKLFYRELGQDNSSEALTIYVDGIKPLHINSYGLNQFSIILPRTINILGTSDNILEADKELVGTSFYRVQQDTLVNRESFVHHVRAERSKFNKYPQYLDKSGRMITESDRYYKHYRSITIKDDSLSGYRDDKTGNYTYYLISNEVTPDISGSAVYDLYLYSDGKYVLIEEDIRENLGLGVSFIKTIGTVKTEVSSSDIKSPIDISGLASGDTITVSPKRVVKDELNNSKFFVLGDPGTETKINSIQYVKFNDVKFEFNSKYTINYNSVSYPIFILDDKIDTLYQGANITVRSPRQIPDSEVELLVEGSNSTKLLWSKFFQYKFIQPDSPEGNYYKYSISIVPRQQNKDPKNYNPCLEKEINGEITKVPSLIRCSVKFGLLKMDFFVIQRPAPTPLKIFSHRSLDLASGNLSSPEKVEEVGPNHYKLVISAKSGKKKSVFTITDALGDPKYGRWSIRNASLLEGLYVGGSGNIVHSYPEESPDSRGSIITTICHKDTEEQIGYFTLRREKTDKTEPLGWEDSIYCGPQNDVRIDLYVAPDTEKDFIIRSSTPYFHTDGARIYLFRESESTWFDVVTKKTENLSVSNPASSVVNVSDPSEREPEGEYKVYRIELEPKVKNTGDTWIGSADGSSTLVPMAVTCGDRTETFYCVVSPKLSPIELYTDGELIYQPHSTRNSNDIVPDYEFGSEAELVDNLYRLRAGNIVNINGSLYKIKAKNYTKLSGNSLSLYDGKVGSEKYKLYRNVYPVGPAGKFGSWVINGTVDQNINVSKKSGKLNQKKDILSGSESVVGLVIGTELSPTSNTLFDPIKFSRYKAESEPEDFKLDWEFKAYSSGDQNLQLKFDPLDTGKIEVATDFFDFGAPTSEFPVDYVGLYRMMIKSEVSSTIFVINDDPRVRFGLFNELTNSRYQGKNKVTVDPSLYGAGGIPVYFYFDGETGDSDITEDIKKKFSTKIVIQHSNDSSVIKELELVRYYKVLGKGKNGLPEVVSDFPEINDIPKYTVVSPNCKVVNSKYKRDIFMSGDSIRIFLDSRLDFRVLINKVGNTKPPTVVVENTFDINCYHIKRGLMSSYAVIEQSGVVSNLPASPTGSLDLSYCNKLGEGFGLNFLIYHIPNLRTDITLCAHQDYGDVTGDLITLLYPSDVNEVGSVQSFSIVPKKKQVPVSGGVVVSIKKVKDFITIEKSSAGGMRFDATCPKCSNESKSRILLNTAFVTVSVNPENFIKSERGKLRLPSSNDGYSSDELQKIAPKKKMFVLFIQEGRPDVEIPGQVDKDTVMTVFGSYDNIPADGDERNYLFIDNLAFDSESELLGVNYDITSIGGTYLRDKSLLVSESRFSEAWENAYDPKNRLSRHIAIPDTINQNKKDSNKLIRTGIYHSSSNGKYYSQKEISVRFRSLAYKIANSNDFTTQYYYSSGIIINDITDLRNEDDGLKELLTGFSRGTDSNFRVEIVRSGQKKVVGTSYDVLPEGIVQDGHDRVLFLSYSSDTASNLGGSSMMFGSGTDLVDFTGDLVPDLGNSILIKSSYAKRVCALSIKLESLIKYLEGTVEAGAVKVEVPEVSEYTPEAARIIETRTSWKTLADVIQAKKDSPSTFGNFKIEARSVLQQHNAVFRFLDSSGNTSYFSIFK